MAYFSNGTEGENLDAQCSECLHGSDDLTILCPIAAVQMDFNYVQCRDGNEALMEAMNLLVDEKGNCKMKPLIDQLKEVNNG